MKGILLLSNITNRVIMIAPSNVKTHNLLKNAESGQLKRLKMCLLLEGALLLMIPVNL